MHSKIIEPDKTISDAISSFSKARALFTKAKKEGLILGNDNHIGDIGEYWVMKFYINCGKFKDYAQKRTHHTISNSLTALRFQ